MGLHNREYMRSPNPDPTQDGRPMLITLIIINIFNYFVFKLPGGSSKLALDMNAGIFDPSNLFQIITAGFAHGDFWHLFFNMWGLYIFGQLVTPFVTRWKFLIIYLAGVVSGNLLYYLTHLNTSGGLLGASGAVCATMIAAAMLEPERRFTLLFLPFSPIKTTTLVICYTVMEVLMLMGNGGGGVSHLAHLGGFIGGYIAMKVIFFKTRLPWDPLSFIKIPEVQSSSGGSYRRPQQENGSSAPGSNSSSNAPVTQRELDALLDKLSREGINSLSSYELERLKKARRQMRGEE